MGEEEKIIRLKGEGKNAPYLVLSFRTHTVIYFHSKHSTRRGEISTGKLVWKW